MRVMTDIKCPICRDRISGRSQDELTETLRAHLADTHQIRRISEEGGMKTSSSGMMAGREGAAWSARDPSMLTPEESRQRDEITRLNRSQLGSESMTKRRMETWSGTEPSGKAPESSEMKYPRMETEEERAVGTWRSENRPRESEQEYWSREEKKMEGGGYGRATSITDVRHGGGTLHRMMNRGEMTMAMSCPLCGNPVYGSDDDDLTDELRFHFKDYHQIRRR